MNKITKFVALTVLSFVNAGCQSEVMPAIVPGVEIKAPEVKPEPQPQPKPQPRKHSLGIIGGVEPVYFLPMKTPFLSRIDTGAETSSIDVKNMEFFERDGKKWIAFDIQNRSNGETHRFEKKIGRQQTVKRIDGSEDRVVVTMTVKMGGEIINAQFSLSDRNKFIYQGLVGRNIITGRAIVDTALSNTLK